jgi:hypothetical protein
MEKYPHSVLVIVSMNIYGSYEKSGRCIPMKSDPHEIPMKNPYPHGNPHGNPP